MYNCLECGRKLHQICVLHVDVIWTDGFICDGCRKQKNIKKKENKFTAKSKFAGLVLQICASWFTNTQV